jgi:GST-like protein
MSIDFYYAPTVNSLRARISLEECGCAFVAHRVDLGGVAPVSDEFAAASPFRLVPALVDSTDARHPVRVSQSGAILLYLADKSGWLLPHDPALRASALEWCMMAVSDASPLNTLIKYLTRDVGDGASSSTAYLERRLDRFFSSAEQALGQSGSEYLLGAYGVADIALFPVVHARWGRLNESRAHRRLCDWAKRIAARPAVKRALAGNGDSNLDHWRSVDPTSASNKGDFQ